jgi:hypothetical protein
MNPTNLQYRVNFLTYHPETCTNLHFEYINYFFLKEKKIVDESKYNKSNFLIKFCFTDCH